jgi:hypothetical protein
LLLVTGASYLKTFDASVKEIRGAGEVCDEEPINRWLRRGRNRKTEFGSCQSRPDLPAGCHSLSQTFMSKFD